MFPKMPWRFGPCFELPPASTVWQALHLCVMPPSTRRLGGRRARAAHIISEEQRRLQQRVRCGRGSRRNARCADSCPSSRARKCCVLLSQLCHAKLTTEAICAATLQCYLVLKIFAPFALISTCQSLSMCEFYSLCWPTHSSLRPPKQVLILQADENRALTHSCSMR